jgi:tetratricopeptide (TPR) repeat protein
VQRARALHDLEHAILLEKPDNPVLALDHTNRGRLLALDHREVEAIAAFEAAIKQLPEHEEAHWLRTDLLRRLNRYKEAVHSCDVLITRGRASSRIYEQRGLARAELRDFAGAIEDLTNAMALRPDHAELLTLRGRLYIVADAPRLALHDFDTAIRLDPKDGDAYNGRGHARLRLGEHREAIADAEQALSLGEPTGQRYYNAARVYALAAVVVAAEARKKGKEAVSLAAKYQDRAVSLVGEAVRCLPAAERASFVTSVVLGDPELQILRRRMSSLELAGPAHEHNR